MKTRHWIDKREIHQDLIDILPIIDQVCKNHGVCAILDLAMAPLNHDKHTHKDGNAIDVIVGNRYIKSITANLSNAIPPNQYHILPWYQTIHIYLDSALITEADNNLKL